MGVREDEVLLMLMPKTKEIFPLAGVALNASQNTKKNLDNTVGSYLLSDCGSVKKIKSIVRKGFLGDTLKSKIKSMVFGVYAIDVTLEDVDMKMDEARSIINDFIDRDLSSECPTFELLARNKQSIMESINQSQSIEEIFHVIKMPKIEDCLDML